MTATEPEFASEDDAPPEPKPVPPPPPTTSDGRTITDVIRENLFLRAGIDVGSPLGGLLLKGYEGPLELDAVKQAAQDVGALAPPVSGDAPSVEDEAKQLGERQNLAVGVEPTVNQNVHPHEAALIAGKTVADRGGTEEDSLAAAFSSLVISAAEGDTRALVTPQQ